MSYKPLWDWMDEKEGKKSGTSHGKMSEERKRQGYNDRMDKIFDQAKSEGRGLVGDSKLKGHGVNSPAMMEEKKKSMAKKMKKHYRD